MPIIKPTNQWTTPIDLTPLREALIAAGVARKYLTKRKLAPAAAALLEPILTRINEAFHAYNAVTRRTYALTKAFQTPPKPKESGLLHLWLAPHNAHAWKRARARRQGFARLEPQPGKTGP